MVLLLLVLATLPAARCNRPDTPAPPGQRSEGIVSERTGSQRAEGSERAEKVSVQLELVDADGKAQRAFESKAPIRLRVTLRNPSELPVDLSFSSGRTHDAVVLGPDGSELWRWSKGRMFMQALGGMQLAPDSESSFELVCDPSAQGAPPLPPGRYRATGLIPAFGGELQSLAVEFEVGSSP